MITIRSSIKQGQPELVALELTLTTPTGIYDLSSISDLAATLEPGLFGRIAWPVSRFTFPPGVALEQQGFLPADGGTAAFSWRLVGGNGMPASLDVRPFFTNCGPRSIRESGFRADADGAQLTWLPHVRGPRFFADTNGITREDFCEREMNGCSLLSPGAFGFTLSERPSVLILNHDGVNEREGSRHIGAFLAGLLPLSSSRDSARPIEVSETNLSHLKAA